jgi:hypothetical protein
VLGTLASVARYTASMDGGGFVGGRSWQQEVSSEHFMSKINGLFVHCRSRTHCSHSQMIT